MQPEQPPYDFIMSSGAEPQKKGFFANATKRQRILVVGGAAMVMLMLLGILLALFSSGTDPRLEQRLKLGQQHAELLRISDIGIRKARGSDARNLATTAKLSLSSYEAKVTEIAKKNQAKVTNAQLAGGKDPKTDEALTTAEHNNRFDEVFTETMYVQIRAYLKQLQTVYKNSTSNSEKQTLDEVHRQLNGLLPSQPED